MPKRKVEEFDTIIIGGGIIGCSIAYHMARAGNASVLLLERNALASGATSRAAALLTQVRAKIHQIPLVIRTYAAIEELEARLGESLGLRRTGSLHIAASAGRREEVLHLVHIAEQHSIPFVRLDPPDAERLVPWLDPSTATEMLFMPDDAVIDPYLLANGYARAARSHGVVIRSGVEVSGLLLNGAIRGIRTREGAILARRVVDASGAWAGLLAWEAGVRLPMAPVRSHYWITGPEASYPCDMPYVILPDASAYIRPELGGLIIGLREPHSLSVDPRTLPPDITGMTFADESEAQDILIEGSQGLRRLFPTLDDARFHKFIAGLSTYTPDGEFIIGPVASLPGYIVATGCCGAGIAASGGFGLAVAELVAGRSSSFDLVPFRLERFGVIDPVSEEFRNRCAAARSAKVSG